MSILVGVARDDARPKVLEVAVKLGKGLDEHLEIVHLVEEENAENDAKRIRDELQDYVADRNVAATVSREHVGHRGPRTGPRIARDLLEIAEDVDVTHIVLGHRSKGMVRDLARGSTAFAVAEDADVPVTIVPEDME